jgi:DNA-binding HxlR family transcriptional regulator
MRPTELGEELTVGSGTLHYHLNKLVDVGLVEKREWKEVDETGLFTYYRVTPMGEVLLDHGGEELMRGEWDLLEAYS